MFRFEDPQYLWLLAIIPFFVLLRMLSGRHRKAKLKRLGDPLLLKQLMPDASVARPRVKFILLLSALTLRILLLARPQMGS